MHACWSPAKRCLRHGQQVGKACKVVQGGVVDLKAARIAEAQVREPSQTMSEAWTAGGEGLQDGARREVVDLTLARIAEAPVRE